MRNKLRIVVAGTACVGMFVMALPGLSAVAGVNRWTAIGPDGANVVALAIDPRTPSTTFAGTLGSGVLKSVDGGVSWASANGALPTVNVLSLAIDPYTPPTLFAGTDAGVFKSTDGGRSWATANNGLIGAPQITINALAIDPAKPATVYAATSGGVFKTIDGAANWTSINSGLSGLTPRVIAIDPVSPNNIYVGIDDNDDCFRCGVFKSTDAGTSWTRIYTTPYFMEGQSVAAIAIDPQSPSRLYLALSGGLVRSVDEGASWSSVISPRADAYPSSLAMDPTSSATLYAGTYSGTVFRTIDAGDHWTPVTDGPLASASINVIAITPSAPATIYAGSRTGIFRSSDGAQSWIHLTLGVRNIGVYPMAVDPTASSTIYAGAGYGVMKTTDGGVHWVDSSSGVSDQLLSSLVIDPASPSTLYAGNGPTSGSGGSSLYKSADAGAHWAPADIGLHSCPVFQRLAIAPSRSSTLYVAQNSCGVSKSIDGGSSWTQVNNGLTAVGAYVSALAVDPTSADIVYVVTSPTGRPDTDGKIFKSTNGAAQWRQVPIALPMGTSITALAIDPATPSTIYAAYSDYGDPGRGGVFKSSDSGETWAAPQSLPDTWVRALAIDPVSPSQIYAATRKGVFRSADAAASWAPINSGLPSLDVWSLSIDRTGSLLRAASAVGLFEYQVNGPTLPATVPVIEYFYAAFGHYFITSNPDEISKLDNEGSAGWTRTGLQFNAYAVPNGNTAPVCRFFSTAFAPKSSHFYSPFPTECATVEASGKWLLESSAAFYIAVPAEDGSCAAGLTPIYRLYNNGQGAAPNHRYTTDFTVRAQMLAQGWVPEGLGSDAVEMCSPP